MEKKVFSAIIAVLTISTVPLTCSAVPVDFTPRPYRLNGDQNINTDVQFFQGDQDIVYRPPKGWRCVKSGAGVLVQPPEEESSIHAEISHADGVVATDWDEAGLKTLRARARALVPKIVKDVKIEGELKNPLKINGHDTIEYVFTGMMLAKPYKFYVLLVPYGDEQFNFLMYADAKEFDKAFQAFDASLYSVRWEKRADVVAPALSGSAH